MPAICALNSDKWDYWIGINSLKYKTIGGSPFKIYMWRLVYVV